MGGGVPLDSAKKKWQTKIPLLPSTTHDNDCDKALMKEHEENLKFQRNLNRMNKSHNVTIQSKED